MSFSTALSGLNAAANNLAVTGNNIANANTTGFKKSRSEFVDMYATSMAGISSLQAGTGVRIAEVAQQFNQGNRESTENNLDMAISGEGFFTLAKDPTNPKPDLYTRAGAFMVDKEGYIVNSQGQFLLAYGSKGTPDRISLNTGTSKPVATSKIELSLNLKADSPIPSEPTFSPTDPNSYTYQTPTTIYDSLGASHKLTTYFVKSSTGDGSWSAHHYITDDPSNPVSIDTGADNTTSPPTIGTPATLSFDSTGKLSSTSTGKEIINLAKYKIPGGAAAEIEIEMNYSNATSLASDFNVDSLKQNGLAAGELTGINIDPAGVISAKFSNGQLTPLGQVVLTRFINPQGLTKVGDTNWAQSISSGTALTGTAGVGRFGAVLSSALEQSNVDLSTQLTNLIIAQQAYQANAQTISTENQIMQTLLNKL
ncbi:MAG: flagellar hook protein FlgE [Methylovulum sp.]|jgi:flagellar hook protein FlgE|nr:flagellar hook protein FlgE [Methylovulum sp.]